MKFVLKIICAMNLIFVTGSFLFAATNIIDNFNDGDVSNWWTYNNPMGSISRSAVTSPAIGGYSMRINGSISSGYWIGGAGYTLPENLKNLTQCTSFRIYLANNEGNTAPSWGWDQLDIKVKDDNNFEITYTIPRPFTSTSLTFMEISFSSFPNHTTLDWSKVNNIVFQIGANTDAGAADFTVDEVVVMGNFPSAGTPLTLDVRIQPRTNKTWYSNGISQITFPNNIDTSGSAPDWILSDSVVLIQYNTSSNHAKLLLYTDNKSGSASPKYTGDDLYGGLVGQTISNTIIPLIWSLYDERISDRTNYKSSWSNNYKVNQPLLPIGFNRNEWTNRSGPYISGYWRNIIEIGSSLYSWNGIGQYECVAISTNDSNVFGSPQNTPLKGTLQQNPEIDYHGGVWIEYKGPFGGFWVNDNYKRDMSFGLDGLSDIIIYLAASFKNKSIQNYKSNKIIIELCNGP